MSDPKPKKIRQYAPVKFGEPFNPKSVEGYKCVGVRQRQSAFGKKKKQNWPRSKRDRK